MAEKIVQHRRKTASEWAAYTGPVAEFVFDTTNKTIRVMDGVQAGGFRLARLDASSNLPMSGAKVTGLGAAISSGDALRFEQLFSQGNQVDLASASIVNIGAQNSTNIVITGTTTITSFGTNYNGPRFLTFTNSLTLTHNASTLICPGNANLPVASGDVVIAIPIGNPGSGWRIVSLQKAAYRNDTGQFPIGTTASNPIVNRVNGIVCNIGSPGNLNARRGSGGWDLALNVNSGTQINFYTDNGTNDVFAGLISSTANTTAYVTSSDYRLKENIAPMVGSINQIMSLTPVTYTWKETKKSSEGFIAHELANIFPDAVIGEKDAVNKEGKPIYQGIDTSFLIGRIVGAFQEQQKIILELSKKVDLLEKSLQNKS